MMIVIPSASRSENSILGNLTHARESEAISSLDVGLGEEGLMLGLGDYTYLTPIFLIIEKPKSSRKHPPPDN